ncbi:MAG: ABC transporter ATP-binding protein/permease [Geminicoccaceae bacterium]
MQQPVLTRVAETRSFLGKVWKLAAPYWWSEERWSARGLLAIILGFTFFQVYLLKLYNDWSARFYNALQEKQVDVFWSELRYFVILVAIFIVSAMYRTWFRQLLTIRWRRWLTEVYTRFWLTERTYYHMELTNHGTDNPEQRIEQDINSFTQQTLTIVLGLIGELITLATFTVILWGLSGSFTLFGINIPGYMFWVALLYALVGSVITYKVGKPLARLNFDLERYNADFRYRMTRIRENSESIALYEGEQDEQRRLGGSFDNIYRVWREFMTYTKRLIGLQSFYGYAASIFPIIVAAPRYFSGAIQFGTIMQVSNAFGQVQGSLSWFVDSFATLADWKAVVDRLTTFSESMERAKTARQHRAFATAASTDGALALEDIKVALPDGRVLLQDVDLKLEPGDRVVIQGPSGSGKTTLFRVLAGLWPFGSGEVRVPTGAKVLFLPQKPYIPLGTLREALAYPDKPEAHAPAEMAQALAACELGGLVDRLDESGNWAMALSPGEQQRLSVARALLVKPDWLFLDEATSALDEKTEAVLYSLLRERLPHVTMVSIAHKPSVVKYHEQRLRLDPEKKRVLVEDLAPQPA